MQEIFYGIVGICGFLVLGLLAVKLFSELSGGFVELIARLFFSLESWKRVVQFLCTGFLIGLLYAAFFTAWNSFSSFGEQLVHTLIIVLSVALIAVIIVNAICIIFRLDKEPKERNAYTQKQRNKDLKRIEETRAQAAEIFSRCSVKPSKTWHTEF